ncbi:MAG: hypothetical protein WC764_04765 [Candidatus Paceibacterota bacterium]|jgi:hypothetical protein
MSAQKVIVVTSMNTTPEDAIANRLAEAGDGWRVISATTTMTAVGTMDIDEPAKFLKGIALHMYYATTLILEQIGA